MHDVHRLLDVLMELIKLHKNVQKPVDVVQNWSVQMYWTRALAVSVSSLGRWNTIWGSPRDILGSPEMIDPSVGPDK